MYKTAVSNRFNNITSAIMEYSKVNLIYFSATSTTRKIIHFIAAGLGIGQVTNYDITQGEQEVVTFGEDEIAIFGVPVYAGRVPAIAVKSLEKFKGANTAAIIVCVYGNRDFDDALLELQEIVSANCFKVISAGAFIAQHSIFPGVGQGRPDESDKTIAMVFGETSLEKLSCEGDINVFPQIIVKGNTPYKKPGSIPLSPKTSKKCNTCGRCVRLCPVQAIDKNNPRKTDKNRCIVCARCISVCPEKAKYFGGLLYWFASGKFTKKHAGRKEPYIVY